MSATTYTLGATDYSISHFDEVVLYCRDGEDQTPLVNESLAYTELDIAVRSGDYLATLATRLDTICHQLPEAAEPEQSNIQAIVDELLRIDASYKLDKRR